MIVFRRRLLYWLIKEYIRKWGKSIAISFVIGLFVFFSLIAILRYSLPKLPIGQNESIGVVGAYRVESLPSYILNDISRGLTTISLDGKPAPEIARQWKIEQNGKKYTFYLRSDVFFSDGTKITSDAITYRFADVKVSRPNKQTIVFELNESYSPFLISVSRPIFKNGLVGFGSYTVRDVKVNGDFVQTIILSSRDNLYKTRTYQFYPSDEALKMAYVLGEVSKTIGLSDTNYKNISFEKFPNTKVIKKLNYDNLVTIFYNTHDPLLSDKRLRSALTYAIPSNFKDGVRTYNPISPRSWAYVQNFPTEQDLEQAKILLSASEVSTKSASIKFELTTLPKYKHTAEDVAKSWKKLGIETTIVVTNTIPDKFQIFLGNFFLPKDPDQYSLWHSSQEDNITNYNNQRIDKLLEDGRKTTSLDERKKIYSDFQKYLLADSPASFLYFPYEYEIIRK